MNFDKFEARGRARIVGGELFTHPNIVIPIMTQGRSYGSVSRAVAGEVELPHLSLCGSKVVHHRDKQFVFLALWDDHTPYSNDHIADCMASALLAATHAHLETLATPLLGGQEGQMYIGAMEQAIDQIETTLEPTGMIPPEVLFVVRR